MNAVCRISTSSRKELTTYFERKGQFRLLIVRKIKNKVIKIENSSRNLIEFFMFDIENDLRS